MFLRRGDTAVLGTFVFVGFLLYAIVCWGIPPGVVPTVLALATCRLCLSLQNQVLLAICCE